MADQGSIYQPLDIEKREIRLLKLIDSGGHNPNDLHFELHEFSLNDPPKFTALTYRWGSERSPKQIYINGRLFPPGLPLADDINSEQLSINLFEYLKQRKAQQSLGWLFVDALCINQTDKRELNNQVQMMGEIYRKTECAVTWLGTKGDPDGIRRMWPLGDYDYQKLSAFWADCEDRLEELCRSPEDVLKLAEVFIDRKEPKARLQYIFMIAFFNWEYWSRLWIVQEVLLPSALRIQFRSTQIEASLLEKFARKYNRAMYSHHCQSESYEDPDNPDVVHRLRQKYIASGEKHRPADFVLATQLAVIFFNFRQRLQCLEVQRRSLPFFDALRVTGGQECNIRLHRGFGHSGLVENPVILDEHSSESELFFYILLEGLVRVGHYCTGGICSKHKDMCWQVWTVFRASPMEPSIAFFTTECLRLCKNEFTVPQYIEVAYDYERITKLSSPVTNVVQLWRWKPYVKYRRILAVKRRRGLERSLTKVNQEDALVKGIQPEDPKQKAEEKLCSVWKQQMRELKESRWRTEEG